MAFPDELGKITPSLLPAGVPRQPSGLDCSISMLACQETEELRDDKMYLFAAYLPPQFRAKVTGDKNHAFSHQAQRSA